MAFTSASVWGGWTLRPPFRGSDSDLSASNGTRTLGMRRQEIPQRNESAADAPTELRAHD